MKKLAVICSSLYRGGAERISIYIAEYAMSKGYQVFLLTGTRNKIEFNCPEGITRYVLGEGGSHFSTGVKRLFHCIKKMRLLIKEKEIDTVLIMGVPLCIYGIPGGISKKTKIFVSERNDPSHFAGKYMTKILSRFLMRRADGYIFQTAEAMRFYGEKISKRAEVIPNPLLTEGLMPSMPYTGKRKQCIVSVGRLDKQKNQKMLIDAFHKIAEVFPEYTVTIWGEGPERRQLEKYISELGMDTKIFLPGMSDDLFNEIADASLFVLTSDFEGMPNALLEAMALGLPCISTDCPCGGPRELIDDGINGYLIPVNDSMALSEKMNLILTDKNISKNISKEAFRVREKYNYEKIGSHWMNFLQK